MCGKFGVVSFYHFSVDAAVVFLWLILLNSQKVDQILILRQNETIPPRTGGRGARLSAIRAVVALPSGIIITIGGARETDHGTDLEIAPEIGQETDRETDPDEIETILKRLQGQEIFRKTMIQGGKIERFFLK